VIGNSDVARAHVCLRACIARSYFSRPDARDNQHWAHTLVTRSQLAWRSSERRQCCDWKTSVARL